MAQAAAGAPGKPKHFEWAKRKMRLACRVGKCQRNKRGYPKSKFKIFRKNCSNQLY